MDKDKRELFDKQQARLEQPECFGEYSDDVKCHSCWFHPDCKNGDAEPKKENNSEKSEGEKLSKPEIMNMLDELEIEYNKRDKKANLEKLLNEAMK